jgi:Integrase core domain
MTHVRTSPYYPQSNGKLERWRKSLKSECIRPGTPLNKQVAQRLIHSYVEHYNNVRLAQRPRVRDTDGNAGGRQTEILPREIASWKKHAGSGKCVASRQHDTGSRALAAILHGACNSLITVIRALTNTFTVLD